MNRLGTSASPYLLQHADNPVDWWPWCDDAFAEARRRDVPVLLSVGYAACHWCHVMAHESFEDPRIAALINEGFVAVKVDREERPDVDAVYMNATVAMTGQGGWPMTCFLTPGGEPFYCGTYYPAQPRHGSPSFPQLLAAIGETWRERRAEVDDVAGRITGHLAAATSGLPPGGRPATSAERDAAVAVVLADEERRFGGFGGAPKFPPSALLLGLLRAAERSGDDAAIGAVERCLDAMAAGGICDQLAGGFARYAVDAAWQVPHFEKMLYDNALLLRVYAAAARRTDRYRAVSAGIIRFLDDALRTPFGYASALDADTDGVEGLTYTWTPAELTAVLGADDGAWAAAAFGVTAAGNIDGRSTLRRIGDPDPRRLADVTARLALARSARPQPARDGKVVTVWNGLVATALVEAAPVCGRRTIEDATWCLDEVFARHVVDGGLRRASLDGVVGAAPGVLEDYAALGVAALTLHAATAESRWLERGQWCVDEALARFADPDRPGSFFDAEPDARLIVRPRDPVDGATPAGASLLAEALSLAADLAAPADAARYVAVADAALAAAAALLAKAPRAAGHWLAVAERPGVVVAIAETETSDGALATAARRLAPSGAVVIAGRPDSVPALADRNPVGGRDAAYVCRGRVCSLPLTDVAEFAAELSGLFGRSVDV